jgi:hypothetical protein
VASEHIAASADSSDLRSFRLCDGNSSDLTPSSRPWGHTRSTCENGGDKATAYGEVMVMREAGPAEIAALDQPVAVNGPEQADHRTIAAPALLLSSAPGRWVVAVTVLDSGIASLDTAAL